MQAPDDTETVEGHPVTGWMPAHTAPLSDRPGMYQRRTNGRTSWARWDGARWLCGAFVLANAMDDCTVSMTQWAPWRGVARDALA